MSWVEEVDVPWPLGVLTDLGYDQPTAKDLRRRLPPVTAGIIPLPGWSKPLHLYEGGDNPAAAIIWALHGPTGADAVRLANSGRDILVLVAILDAVDAVHADRLWTPSKIRLAESWVEATAIPSDRAVRYIAAGITAHEATDFENDPATRPSDAQLALLAGLLASAPHP